MGTTRNVRTLVFVFLLLATAFFFSSCSAKDCTDAGPPDISAERGGVHAWSVVPNFEKGNKCGAHYEGQKTVSQCLTRRQEQLTPGTDVYRDLSTDCLASGADYKDGNCAWPHGNDWSCSITACYAKEGTCDYAGNSDYKSECYPATGDNAGACKPLDVMGKTACVKSGLAWVNPYDSSAQFCCGDQDADTASSGTGTYRRELDITGEMDESALIKFTHEFESGNCYNVSRTVTYHRNADKDITYGASFSVANNADYTNMGSCCETLSDNEKVGNCKNPSTTFADVTGATSSSSIHGPYGRVWSGFCILNSGDSTDYPGLSTARIDFSVAGSDDCHGDWVTNLCALAVNEENGAKLYNLSATTEEACIQSVKNMNGNDFYKVGDTIYEDKKNNPGVCVQEPTGYSYFYDNGDSTKEACENIINSLHATPFSEGKNWVGDSNSNGACCGDDATDPGSLYQDADGTLYVCTAKNGVYEWVSSQDENNVGRVYEVEDKAEYWRTGQDANNADTSSIDYQYLVGLSNTGVASCSADGVAPNFGSPANTLAFGQHSNFNADGKGFYCMSNTTFTVTGNEFGTQEEDSSLLRMAVCGGSTDDNTYQEGLMNGEFAGHPNGEIEFCTEAGIFTDDLDAFDDTYKRLGESGQFAGESVALEAFYGEEYYAPLDRFWRTGSFTCGDDLIQNNVLDYEFYNDNTTVGYGQLTEMPRTCWNNRVVANGGTISSVVNQDGAITDFNLLRFTTADNYFAGSGHAVLNWMLNAPNEIINNILGLPAINDDQIVEGNTLMFYDVNEGVEPYSLVLFETKHPVHLVKDVEYVLLVDAQMTGDLANEFPSIITTISSGETSKQLHLDPAPLSFAEELGLSEDIVTSAYHATYIPETTGLYDLSFSVANPVGDNNVEFTLLDLIPRPHVLNDAGHLYACEAKNNTKRFSDLKDTTTTAADLIPNDRYVSYCEQERGSNNGGFVCSPEGVWIPALDDGALHSIPESDWTDDNTRRSHVSVSPNILEDSSFKYGNGILMNDCSFITENSDNPTVMNKGGDFDELMDSGDDVAKDTYLSCSLSDKQIAIKDSNGQPLEDGEYIFSAWMKGSGSIDIVDSQTGDVTIPAKQVGNRVLPSYTIATGPVEIPSTWQRIEVHGNTVDGVVTLAFSGSFEIDGVQLEKAHFRQKERGKYFTTVTRRSCCPSNSCWNGEECVYLDGKSTNYINTGDELLANPDFVTNDDEKGYICIDGGSYSFREKKYRWVENEFEDAKKVDEYINHIAPTQFGFCEPNSCFVGRDKAGVSDTSVEVIMNRSSCVPGIDNPNIPGQENVFYGHVCELGSWTTNTAPLASFLTTLVEDKEPYSIYCGDYEDVLNYASYDFDITDDDTSLTNLLDEDLLDDVAVNVPYVDRACVLKYGSNMKDIVIGLPLNDELTNIPDVLTYFGSNLRITGTCDSDTPDDVFSTCTNGNRMLYDDAHNVLLYVRDPSLYNTMKGTSLTTDTIKQSSWIEDIKNHFLAYDFTKDTELYKEALVRHDNYDELFVFANGDQEIKVTRQKLINYDGLDNNFYYLYGVKMSGFNADEDFIANYSINSPVHPSQNPSLVDVFNTTNTADVVMEHSKEQIYGLYVSTDDAAFKDWYTFTGRLRGDVTLPQ